MLRTSCEYDYERGRFLLFSCFSSYSKTEKEERTKRERERERERETRGFFLERMNDEEVSKFVDERRRVYTPTEVSFHNCEHDCWVSIFHKVYDLTDLIKKHKNHLVNPIVKFAGKDISEWFDEKTGNIRTKFDSNTNMTVPDMPHGRFVHAPPLYPIPWKNDFETPWWEDENYCIGTLSKRTRKIRVVNVLSKQEKILEVCSEETMKEILNRYLNYNSHAGSYTWKALFDGDFVPLDMDKTLKENEIPDESDEFERLSIEEDFYYPPIYLYFNDDLTVA